MERSSLFSRTLGRRVPNHGGGIFINYRQRTNVGCLTDHAQFVEALANRLGTHFGHDQVFVDTTGIKAGEPYPEKLEQKLNSLDVLIAVIHRNWLQDLADRLSSADLDWVRHEIVTALDNGKLVIPVLLDEIKPLKRSQLPLDLERFAIRQAVQFEFGKWTEGMAKLIAELERHVAPRYQQPSTEQSASDPRRRRWLLPLLTILCPAAVVAPSLVALSAHFKPGEGAVVMATVARTLAWLLIVVVAASGIKYLLTRRLGWIDERLAELPRTTKANMVLSLSIAGLIILSVLANTALGIELGLPVIGVAVVIAVWLGAVWLRDRDKLAQWPPDDVDANPAAIRGAVARLRERMGEWQAPLPRIQRDQATHASGQNRQAIQRLRLLNDEGRHRWWRSVPASLYLANAVLLAATVGATGTAVVLYLDGGERRWVLYLWSACVVALGGLSALASAKIAARRAHWLRATVLTDIPAKVDALDQDLAKLE
ncbi:MAG TPA: toll/interleukin-1 receptor domain-containing protein [Pseudonocardiaceae bacterium]